MVHCVQLFCVVQLELHAALIVSRLDELGQDCAGEKTAISGHTSAIVPTPK
jgi:hypothetical protein